MLIEAAAPITVRLHDGPRQLVPGDRLDLPDDKGLRLLELAKEKVRLVQVQLFSPGDRVTYRVPIIRTPTDYSWEWHSGIVQEMNERLALAIITPSDRPQAWIGVPFVYVRADEKKRN